MLAKLRDLLVPQEEDGPSSSRGGLHLAAAVLMVDVARSDYENDPNEYRALKERLIKILDLNVSDVDQLINDAEMDLDNSVSLHNHVDVINKHYSQRQKFDLICTLWQIAYSDGFLHHYEEHLIRRISDLLYVPHRDFIRAKYISQPD